MEMKVCLDSVERGWYAIVNNRLLGRFPSMTYNRLNRAGVTYSYLSRQARLESTNCARI